MSGTGGQGHPRARITFVGLGLICLGLVHLGSGIGSRAIGVDDGVWGQELEVPSSLFAPRHGEPTAEQVAQWVRDLDDDRFVVRRNATDRLISAGMCAVEPVAKAVEGANLEVSTRGVFVLRELALSSDVGTQDAALQALQQLSLSPARSAARLAQSAIGAMEDVRQERAMKQLEQLGATITVSDRSVGFQLTQTLVVDIGATWEGTAEDLHRLKWLRDVQEISFSGERINDVCLRSLVHLQNLNRISFRHAGITDDGLRLLASLKSLTTIDLMYTPVTDAGLEHLKEMKSVRLIRCYGTDVTQEAAERFQQQVANVQVDHKVGAFLGVVCQQAPWPCEVTQVKSNSAAMQGGIRESDIIVRYDGQPVANFDELRKLIGRNKVGDTVAVEVARGATMEELVLPRLPGVHLGLEGETTPYGCKVNQVEPQGAAAKAGLRSGDVITLIDEERVTDVDQLKKIYAKRIAVKQSELQVMRNSQIVRTKVTFGEWSDL